MSARDELRELSEELQALQQAVEAVASLPDSPIRDALVETLAGLMFGDAGYTLTDEGRAMLDGKE